MKNILFSACLLVLFAISCTNDNPATDTGVPSVDDVETPDVSNQVKPLNEKVLTPDTVTQDDVDDMQKELNEKEAVNAELMNYTSADKPTKTTNKKLTNAVVKTPATVSPTVEDNSFYNADDMSDPRNQPKPEEPPVVTNNTTTEITPAVTKVTKPAYNHDIFDGLLRRHVNSAGMVDYRGFQKEKAALQQYIELLANNAPESSWSKNKEMAYWINLYNAFTIMTIVKNYPVNSITDIAGGKVWDTEKVTVGGKSYTLNQIEKDKLLKRFSEPRVHFAVNCAAASCPPLLNKAWTESNVQRYYEAQAKSFMNNNKYNNLSTKSIEISKIFDWYASDFGGKDKVLSYVQKYSNETIKDNAKVSYKEYDWKLNKQ